MHWDTLMGYSAEINGRNPTCLLFLEFPDSEERLPDDFARRMFHASSVLPPRFSQALEDCGIRTSPATRGFAVNGDLTPIFHIR